MNVMSLVSAVTDQTAGRVFINLLECNVGNVGWHGDAYFLTYCSLKPETVLANVQFDEEFEMLQPEANDFFFLSVQLAPCIIFYAKQKAVNPDVQSLISELSNSGPGESAGGG